MKNDVDKKFALKANLIVLFVISLFTVLIYEGCGGGFNTLSSNGSSSLSSIKSSDPIVAGEGANFAGTGNLTVATADAIIARIQNGLQGNVNPTSGNFAAALTQVKANLPQVPDPTKATGYDQAQLLIYAACSDLTTGSTPKMQSVYKVTKTGTIASNQTALIAAGMTILDQHFAGLASGGPASAQLNTDLTNLVTTISSDTANTNTSTIAFVSVCMAANTAGVMLMGF